MFRGLALLLLSIAPLAAQTLDGKVIQDDSNALLASVELRIGKDGARQLVADLETGADGRFHAEGIPPGDYRVEVTKPNFVPLTLRVRFGGSPLILRLVRFGVISGRPGTASQRRLEELRFKHLVFGERDKLQGYARLAQLGLQGLDQGDQELGLDLGLLEDRYGQRHLSC